MVVLYGEAEVRIVRGVAGNKPALVNRKRPVEREVAFEDGLARARLRYGERADRVRHVAHHETPRSLRAVERKPALPFFCRDYAAPYEIFRRRVLERAFAIDRDDACIVRDRRRAYVFERAGRRPATKPNVPRHLLRLVDRLGRHGIVGVVWMRRVADATLLADRRETGNLQNALVDSHRAIDLAGAGNALE